jgi:hypothetical protein
LVRFQFACWPVSRWDEADSSPVNGLTGKRANGKRTNLDSPYVPR